MATHPMLHRESILQQVLCEYVVKQPTFAFLPDFYQIYKGKFTCLESGLLINLSSCPIMNQ